MSGDPLPGKLYKALVRASVHAPYRFRCSGNLVVRCSIRIIEAVRITLWPKTSNRVFSVIGVRTSLTEKVSASANIYLAGFSIRNSGALDLVAEVTSPHQIIKL